jgi:DNA-binding transcriptional regulator YhcF (GntR family)
MVQGDIGTFDTRFERLTRHYADAITRAELKPGDRFPSARELSEMHGVGRTTAGRVHGTLISMGLIEHRPGVGTFVLGPSPRGKGTGRRTTALEAAAQKAVAAFDGWHARNKPSALVDAMEELRDALHWACWARSAREAYAAIDEVLQACGAVAVKPPGYRSLSNLALVVGSILGIAAVDHQPSSGRVTGATATAASATGTSPFQPRSMTSQ